MTTDPTAEFIADLQHQRELPRLQKVTGTLRIDVMDGKRTRRWFVTITKGIVSVSRQGGDADCVLKAPKPLMDGIVTGVKNPLTAALRGELLVVGEPELLVLFQRVLPGPASSSHPRAAELADGQ